MKRYNMPEICKAITVKRAVDGELISDGEVLQYFIK